MLGLTELQATLRKIQQQILTAESKEKSAKEEGNEWGKEISSAEETIRTEQTRIATALSLMDQDLAEVSYADKFQHTFSENVRSILQGSKVKTAFADMEGIVGNAKKKQEKATQLSLDKNQEKKRLKTQAEAIKQQIRQIEQMGAQG